MALQAILPAERFRHDIDPEMSLAARPMPGMSFVPVGLIHHVEALRGESFRQLFGDHIAGCHDVRLAGAKGCGQHPRAMRR